ncbi:MAG: DUF4192 domain-containing protein [Actinomycetota bacterium]|nr:DUF4192 domain-containing protein [Actinomycetota bacterium]
MSKKKSKSSHKPRAADGRPTTVVRDPSDVIVIIPYLLGFDPVDSVVVVALEGPRKRFGPCFRLDLAGPDEVPHQVSTIVGIVERLGCATVLIVVFSDDPQRADTVARAACAQLDDRGVTVKEALRADGGRWWSYSCDSPECCSPDGTPYDASTSRVAAEAVVAGMQRLPSRDSLRVQFEPLVARCSAIESIRRETELPALSEDEFTSLLAHGLGNPQALGDPDLLRLATAVQGLVLRDLAWSEMSRADAELHFALWSHVMRCVPADLLAPVGSLTAFAAWLQGTGVLASHAVDRVLAVYPRYSMAGLIAQILQSGVNPCRWDEMGARELRSSSDSAPLAG